MIDEAVMLSRGYRVEEECAPMEPVQPGHSISIPMKCPTVTFQAIALFYIM
jgi:hypothetical protein